MTFTSHLAERRFGYGPSPRLPGPESVAAMLATLTGPDAIAARLPQPTYRALQDALVLRRRFRGFARKNPETEEGKEADARQREIYAQAEEAWLGTVATTLARRAGTVDAFRERLVAFWGDHFTARGKGGMLRFAAPSYLEEAVRPNITGTFPDLLTACVMHPLMLHYLDQDSAVGPNSRLVRRRDLDRGLNENLAREVLELHTLGVGGPYSQTDVRELAELFTGLSRTRDYSFVFRRTIAEPGAETVLGKTYGQGASPDYVRAALRDLALHPATARHIARKLAVHFVADAPSDALVGALEETYRDSGGGLTALYTTLLEHSDSWQSPATNIRPPQEFLSASLRALDLEEALTGLNPRDTRQLVLQPLRPMGQVWEGAPGPDGWPEEDSAWVTPQGIAARLEWAMQAPARLMQDLPDPRDLLGRLLGGATDERLAFAINAAENRAVGLGLLLCSPALQRR
ncbi:MAG: DUF1800 domain-containing protein [Sulfitobacter sp.]|nr:DUF1800 domain-containing protein [Sulfitobacter sp.]